MKAKYYCEKCGEDFDDEKKCDEHERNCPDASLLGKRVRDLEKQVVDLERKVAELSGYVDVLRSASPQPYSPYPLVTGPAVPPKPGPFTYPQVVYCRNDDAKVEGGQTGIQVNG